ncbi:DUF4129 domain-containing protein [Streptomyces sp. XM4193]|uniref:DUF4129 domain-containing protein n=1 Tax=Streptomyces sp. XM4193 TaxID=2929782 RepID=UPI001FFB587B|nr:DUF4129 domain-containing protein [Streptomyces sp. XM4193]MCK1799167.1 DUF4129 domain-containing protein [Streptomyces sp. XM4193]
MTTAPVTSGLLALVSGAAPSTPGSARRAAGPDPSDGPPVVVDREAAREAAERELTRSEYSDAKPGPVRRAADWLVEQVEQLLGLTADGGTAGWVRIAVLLVLAVLVALAVPALLRRLGPLRRHTPGDEPSLFTTGPRDARQHRAAAERFAAAGDWERALQERMRAVVRSLEEANIVAASPARTAGEAAEEAGRALPRLAPALAEAAASFDEVTYAHRRVSSTAYHQVTSVDTALEQHRRTSRATTVASGGRR